MSPHGRQCSSMPIHNGGLITHVNYLHSLAHTVWAIRIVIRPDMSMHGHLSRNGWNGKYTDAYTPVCRQQWTLIRSDQFDFTVSNLSIGHPHKSPFICFEELPWSVLSNRIKTQKCNQKKVLLPLLLAWLNTRRPFLSHLPKQLLVTQKAVTTRQSRQIVSGFWLARATGLAENYVAKHDGGRQLGIVKIAVHCRGHPLFWAQHTFRY